MQYELGMIKIDITTSRPEDDFVYYGEGQDETASLAVMTLATPWPFQDTLSEVLALNMAMKQDPPSTTRIQMELLTLNSNTNGTANLVQHPNTIKNGFDDGFVISADADTGDAKWMVAHPKSIDLDADGNIYWACYSCTMGEDKFVTCDGFLAKFSADDGSILWEQKFTDLGAAESDDSLYVRGTTTYFGEISDDKPPPKETGNCPNYVRSNQVSLGQGWQYRLDSHGKGLTSLELLRSDGRYPAREPSPLAICLCCIR